jgi:hypothetical protein
MVRLTYTFLCTSSLPSRIPSSPRLPHTQVRAVGKEWQEPTLVLCQQGSCPGHGCCERHPGSHPGCPVHLRCAVDQVPPGARAHYQGPARPVQRAGRWRPGRRRRSYLREGGLPSRRRVRFLKSPQLLLSLGVCCAITVPAAANLPCQCLRCPCLPSLCDWVQVQHQPSHRPHPPRVNHRHQE